MATTDTWDSPALDQPINADLPAIKNKFQALVKGDPSLVQNPPVGAKRLVEINSGDWQVQQYNGRTWSNIGKLKMDVDTVDGYDAAITPQANTVAVRNASGLLEDSITGNAATASSAATLSQTLPVNKGGTGATTSAQARTNLGVPPTSHASSSTKYGLATDANYGHVRSDGKTTNIVAGEVAVKDVAIGGDVADLARNRGQIGDCYTITPSIDFNTLFKAGRYWFTNAVIVKCSNKPPTTIGGFCDVLGEESSNNYTKQIYHEYNRPVIYIREHKGANSGWSETWTKIITEKDLATNSTPGLVTIDKTNGTTGVRDGGELYVVSSPKQLSYNVMGASGQYQDVCTAYRLEKGSSGNSRLLTLRAEAGDSYNGVAIFSTNQDTNDFGACFRVYNYQSGTKLCFTNCDLQVNNGNGIVIAANVLQTGDLVASMNTSHRGCLLCKGSAVSRTTYANLFALLGTTFGEGDGSTTFNLPDFRNKTLWGANGNLMAILAAGLPNITGGISIGALTGGASGAITARSSSVSRSTTDASNSSGFDFNASRSSSIYGNSTTVQPPAIAVNIFIKY